MQVPSPDRGARPFRNVISHHCVSLLRWSLIKGAPASLASYFLFSHTSRRPFLYQSFQSSFFLSFPTRSQLPKRTNDEEHLPNDGRDVPSPPPPPYYESVSESDPGFQSPPTPSGDSDRVETPSTAASAPDPAVPSVPLPPRPASPFGLRNSPIYQTFRMFEWEYGTVEFLMVPDPSTP